MRFKLLPAILLYLGSYFPLSLILTIQDIKIEFWNQPACSFPDVFTTCTAPVLGNPRWCWTLIAITFSSLVFLKIYLHSLKPKSKMVLTSVKPVPNDLVNYVFPYVVSFMGITLADTSKLVGAIVFLGFMFLISFRSGEVILNPILLLFGWNIYECDAMVDGQHRSFKAICKTRIHAGDRVGSRLAQEIQVVFKGEQ